MQIVSRREVEECLSAQRDGKYIHIIENLEPGMAIRLNAGEWDRRTPINYYFLKAFNKGKKVVSVRQVGPRDYLVIKL